MENRKMKNDRKLIPKHVAYSRGPETPYLMIFEGKLKKNAIICFPICGPIHGPYIYIYIFFHEERHFFENCFLKKIAKRNNRNQQPYKKYMSLKTFF